MFDEKSRAEVNLRKRGTGTIVVVLCMGIIVFAMYVLYSRQDKPVQPMGLVTQMSLGFAVICTFMHLIVPFQRLIQGHMMMKKKFPDRILKPASK